MCARLAKSARWSIAFDRYAMGSALVQHQLSYPAAIAHKNVCTQLGLTSRSASMAVIYDEVARYLPIPMYRLICALPPPCTGWQEVLG